MISVSRDFSKPLESGPATHNLASSSIFHHGGTEGIRWCGQRQPTSRPVSFNLLTPCPPIAWPLVEEDPARQGRGVACRNHLEDAEGDSRVKALHGLLIFC